MLLLYRNGYTPACQMCDDGDGRGTEGQYRIRFTKEEANKRGMGLLLKSIKDRSILSESKTSIRYKLNHDH